MTKAELTPIQLIVAWLLRNGAHYGRASDKLMAAIDTVLMEGA